MPLLFLCGCQSTPVQVRPAQTNVVEVIRTNVVLIVQTNVVPATIVQPKWVLLGLGHWKVVPETFV